MAGRPKPHVFLSHVREDAERIDRLASDLEARDIETWIDRHKIRPGERWEKAIEDAIRSGAFFVACFSTAYSARDRTYMNEELHIAFQEVRLRPADRSWFIPIRLDDCEIPALPIAPNLTVRSFQWLDLFPNWEKGVERLAEAIASSSRPDQLREPLFAAEPAPDTSEHSTALGKVSYGFAGEIDDLMAQGITWSRLETLAMEVAKRRGTNPIMASHRNLRKHALWRRDHDRWHVEMDDKRVFLRIPFKKN